MKIFNLIFLLAACSVVSAQQNINRRVIAPSATITLSEIKNDFDPDLFSLEMMPPGSGSYREYLSGLKEKIRYRKPDPFATIVKTNNHLPQPAILSAFEGNPHGSSVPNDNDMAISNGGKIISVINSSIYIYDTEGSQLFNVSLSAFSDTLGLPSDDFDPRVVYDPVADKFILVFLNGFNPATSFIIVAFSKTNDPAGEWNLYALPGNPKENDLWTDYPMMAITQNELFVTGNLLIPSEPWQTAFVETVIWEMSLDEGYTGDTLHAVFRDNILHDGKAIRNLCPVKGGSATYGPDMYFLSNRNFAESNDTIFLIHITGDLTDSLAETNISVLLSDNNYGVPPQARQLGSHIFDTNDGRILEAFMENGHIQCVANSIHPGTLTAGIYHAIIDDYSSTPWIHSVILADSLVDFGYPDISYTGRFDTDLQSIITFDHSGDSAFAGMSAFFFDDFEYSDRLVVKEGETYVNAILGSYERWGDYTGSQPKYDEPGVVWISGNFGKLGGIDPIVTHDNATWIAKLKSMDSLPPTAVVTELPDKVKVYPNPVHEYFITEFSSEGAGEVIFEISDSQGRKIKTLLIAKANPGINRFSFSTEPLTPGTYFLSITMENRLIATETIVRQ